MKYGVILVLLTFCVGVLRSQPTGDPLSFPFDRHYGQVEVGGPYAGAEFHGSRPLPARISFYYPVANSIDLSTDYWKRDASQPMVIGIRRDSEPKEWIGKDAWTYVLSPHTATFSKSDRGLEYRISYQFCLNRPAMVQSFVVRNAGKRPIAVEAYVHLALALRTCQSYARKDSASTEYDAAHRAIIANFDAPDADRASIFVANAGEAPNGWTSDASALGVTDSGTSNWLSTSGLGFRLMPGARKGAPVAAFVFRKKLRAGDSLLIVQVIGSCRRAERSATIAHLASSWPTEVSEYDRYVRGGAEGSATFVTGDPWLDRSAVWARGLLRSNRHYLDGAVVPMPCPAEYNFFFTHDLLLTDLGAVNFDLPRVKHDLLYVASHAKDGIIPHAYYWRDDGFKTEYCTPENWNHLWFIIATARYLRHSGDTATGDLLYPLITKSLTEILTQRMSDTLMYAFRPDWWDIGHRTGPRSYITILTIRALRDYLYASSLLDHRSATLRAYEELADAMERALGARLWDDTLKYLVNYNDTLKDTHFYMGSLLAPVYGVLEQGRSEELLATASRQLLRSPVGVMVAAPPDFHTEAMRAFFKFAGNEAGDPYIYANGGIWPHANAFYALALNAIGRSEDALAFVRTTMTIDGVNASPNGQPAMYEYRQSDSSSKAFGTIDKPSFLWAGGFYMNVLYALSGFQENEWNLSFSGSRPVATSAVRCSYEFGELHDVTIEGRATTLRSLASGSDEISSLVLPESLRHSGGWTLTFGPPARPYLERVNAIVEHVGLDHDGATMDVTLSSFSGHRISMTLVALRDPIRVTLDGREIAPLSKTPGPNGTLRLQLEFQGTDAPQHVTLTF